MKKLSSVFIIFLIFVNISFGYEEGSRITWDYTTLSKVYHGYSTYARVIRLHNNNLICAFEHLVLENDTVVGFLMASRSENNGLSWSKADTVVKHSDGINPSVPDLIQLNNGWILCSYNPRPRKQDDSSKKFSIKNMISKDNGYTWEFWSDVYAASHLFGDGVWEPSAIQLASEEIQLFVANEYPYQSSNEQEISMFRSFDNGYTWSDKKIVCFRAGHRDGMPVPLILKNNKGLVFYFDRSDKNDSILTKGNYKIIVDLNLNQQCFFGENGEWKDYIISDLKIIKQLDGTVNNNTDQDNGYIMEIKIPWSKIGGNPKNSSAIGFNFSLVDNRDGGIKIHRETISGNIENNPSTWCKLNLINPNN